MDTSKIIGHFGESDNSSKLVMKHIVQRLGDPQQTVTQAQSLIQGEEPSHLTSADPLKDFLSATHRCSYTSTEGSQLPFI